MQPDTVSWVPHEWPGPAWKLRAWISGNKRPSHRTEEKSWPSPLESFPHPQPLSSTFSWVWGGERPELCSTRDLSSPPTDLFGRLRGNPSLRFPSVSGSWMFSWCPPCPFWLFPVSIVSMCKSSLSLPSPRPARLLISGLYTVSVPFLSLSLCLDVLLCVTQWVSLFLVCFFF